MYNNGHQIVKKFVKYLSKILSHDSLYVIDCIKMLIKDHMEISLNEIIFWSDNGCHFRSSELYYYVLKMIPIDTQFKKSTLNFFVEYHGKSEVDGHFGYLQRIYNFYNKTKKIDDIDNLIDIFQKYINKDKKQSQCVIEVYSRENRPQRIDKMMIKESKKYLSFQKLGNGLIGGSVYSKNVDKYEKVEFNMKEVADNRNTRYCFYGNNNYKKYNIGSRIVKTITYRYLLANKNI